MDGKIETQKVFTVTFTAKEFYSMMTGLAVAKVSDMNKFASEHNIIIGNYNECLALTNSLMKLGEVREIYDDDNE